MAKLLIEGGRVVTMDPGIGDLERGDVLIDGSEIAAIGAGLAPGGDVETIDAAGMIVMPGLVNAHIHTWQTGLRGLAGDWTATNYFRAMHAGLATFFRPEDIHIANSVGALNQIDCGVTTIVDWHHNNPTPEHSDAAIDGLADSGIRALFLHGSPKPDPGPGQKPYGEIPMPRGEVERLRKGRFAGDGGLLSLGLAVLGPQMSVHDVALEDFRLARDCDIVASLHHSGAAMPAPRGYAAAAAAGLIGDKVNVVHGNALTDADFDLLVEHGATFTVTAEVEMQMAYGPPLTGRLRARGVPVAIGTDVECAYGADMFAVMRTTLQLERHAHSMRSFAATGDKPHPIPVTAAEALGWATRDGARMAHLDTRTGSLTPGKQADIACLRGTDLNLVGAGNATNAIALHANPGNVDTVLVAGSVRKRGGRIVCADLDARKAALVASTGRILADFKATGATAEYL